MTYVADNSTATFPTTPVSMGDTLAERFNQSVAKHGARTAVVSGDLRLSYDDLNRAANDVAKQLMDVAARGSFVAIYLERSVEMIAALLGVVKRGAAYLPIDASYPAARVLDTLDDARPVAAITTRALAEKLGSAAFEAMTVVLVDDLLSSADTGAMYASMDVDDSDAAYVIYTSGSTGKPKGVMVSHRNVVRLIDQTQPWFGFDEHDVWTMFHSLAFD